jgi:putative DNA primase/helicase
MTLIKSNYPVKTTPSGKTAEDFRLLDLHKKIKNSMTKSPSIESPLSQSPLLQHLLSKIHPVDFKTLAGHDSMAAEKKLTQKELIVCIIDELFKVAELNAWGLSQMNGLVFLYTGKYWSKVETDDFKNFLGDAACSMGLQRTCAKYYGFQDQLYLQFMASPRLNIDTKNEGITLINLQNGTFEINNGSTSLRNFDRKDALTYQLPFEFISSAACPIFMAYLDRVLPDKDLQNILAEYIGYIFTKHLKLEKCLLLFGSGANGKSVFFDIVNALLGKENVSNFSLQDLGQEHNRALLGGKLLNYGSEIRSSIEADTFKQLVSGEPVQCRLKYGNSFTLDNYARMCFNCNELPRDVEHTEAFFRRFLIVPFNQTIPENERNPNLAKEIIKSELSGVFNWVLEGLHRLLEDNKFSDSAEITSAIDQYKKQSDSVYLFTDESGYIKSATNQVLLKDLYPQYRTFCISNGLYSLGKPNFSRRLSSLGYNIERRNIGMVVHAQIQERN